LSLTQQPFGETEKQVRHDERGDDVLIEGPKSVENTLGDVDFLDLDAAGNKMRPNEEDELDRRINPVPDDHLGKPPAGVQTTSDSSTSAVSPSSLLNTATAFIPSIPFLSSSSRSSKSASPEKARGSSSFASMRLDGRDQRQGVDGTIDKQDSRPDSRPEVPSFQAPPNPMAAQAGESTALPSRDGTLSSYSKELDASYDRRNALEGLEMLPKVEAGEGEGPDVLYGKHLVLDMAGYHSTRKATEEEHTQVEAAGGKEAEKIQQSPPQMEDGEKLAVADSDAQTIIKGSLIDTFAHDLISSIHPPITSLLSPSRPLLPSTRTASTTISQVVPVDEKIFQPAQPGASPFSMSDLPKAIDALSLESGNLGVVHTHSQSRRRNDRGHSEPPQFPEDSNNLSISVPPRSELLDSSSPPMSDTFSGTSIQRSALITASAASNADMDYAWDWGRVSSQSNEEDIKDSQQPSREMERSSSGPPATNGETSEQRMRNDSSTSAGMDLATSAVHRGTLASLPGKLKNVEDSPFMFVLDMDDGRSHSFELALCGEPGFALLGDTSVSWNHLGRRRRFTRSSAGRRRDNLFEESGVVPKFH